MIELSDAQEAKCWLHQPFQRSLVDSQAFPNINVVYLPSEPADYSTGRIVNPVLTNQWSSKFRLELEGIGRIENGEVRIEPLGLGETGELLERRKQKRPETASH